MAVRLAPSASTAHTDVVDASLFRSVLSHFCSGVTVIAAMNDGLPVGLTCQSFFSLSLDPPMVAFSVSRTSTSFPAIRSAGSLVINILGSEQGYISDAFARTGTDKWAGIAWRRSAVLDLPVIEGSVAHLECDIETEVDGGDHVLVIARVRHLAVHAAPHDSLHSPLVFYRGRYSRLDSSASAPEQES